MFNHVLSADWHLGLDRLHDEDVERAAREMSERSRWLLFAGDLFHHWRPKGEDIARAVRLLRMFDRVSLCAGNHDVDPEGSGLDAVRELSDILVPPPHGVALLHGVVQGVTGGAERELEVGNPEVRLPRGITMAVLGHPHTAQRFSKDGVLVVCPGSPARVSHAEEKDVKGFFVVRADGRVLWKDLVRSRPFVTYREEDAVGITGSGAIRVLHSEKINREKTRRYLLGRGFDSVTFKKERSKDRWVAPPKKAKTAEDLVRSRLTDGALKMVMNGLKRKDRAADVAFGHVTRVEVENYQGISRHVLNLAPGSLMSVVAAAGGDPARSNGGAKTSLIDAIRFAFTRRSRFSKNELSVKDGHDWARVTVSFRDAGDNNDSYELWQGINDASWIRKNGSIICKGPAQVSAWLARNAIAPGMWDLCHLSGSVLKTDPAARADAVLEQMGLRESVRALKDKLSADLRRAEAEMDALGELDVEYRERAVRVLERWKVRAERRLNASSASELPERDELLELEKKAEYHRALLSFEGLQSVSELESLLEEARDGAASAKTRHELAGLQSCPSCGSDREHWTVEPSDLGLSYWEDYVRELRWKLKDAEKAAECHAKAEGFDSDRYEYLRGRDRSGEISRLSAAFERASAGLAGAESSFSAEKKRAARFEELFLEAHDLREALDVVKDLPLSLAREHFARADEIAAELLEEAGTWQGLWIHHYCTDKRIEFSTGGEGIPTLPIEGRSAGQYALLNLAYQEARRRAFEENGMPEFSLLLADEALDSLDDENARAAARMLKSLDRQCLVVSHLPRAISLLPETTVLKEQS